MNEPRTEAGRRLLHETWTYEDEFMFELSRDGIIAVEQEAASVDVERLRQARLFVIESVRQFVKDDPLGGGRERTLKFLDGIAFGEGRDDPDAFAAETPEASR